MAQQRLQLKQKHIYIFQGWMTFVAFMDATIALRCFVEKRCFLGEYGNSKVSDLVEARDQTLPRVLGFFAILKALILLHCTLYVDHKPVISMGMCAVVGGLLLYAAETFVFHSVAVNFYVIFPSLLNGVALIGLIMVFKRLQKKVENIEEENAELLKMADILWKRKKLKRH